MGIRSLEEPPRPTPLLWPAVAFIGGIWVSESFGAIAHFAHWLSIVLALAAAALLVAGVTGFPAVSRRSIRSQPVNPCGTGLRPVVMGRPIRLSRDTLPMALVLLLAAGAGFVRHQAVVRRPPDHITKALADEPVLTRLVGEVIATPLWQPGERRNPFLPFDPPGQTRLVVAAREFRTTEAPIPTSGRVRVSVADEQVTTRASLPPTTQAAGRKPDRRLMLRLGDRVELTGKLYRPRGPQNPGEVDWARWSYLQGIDAGLSVEGPAYVRRLEGERAWTWRVLTVVRAVAENLLLEPYADVGAEHASRIGATEEEPPAAGTTDEVARLLDTMVLGQRAVASREINEAFLRAGAMHVLAVSGFNVSLLAGSTWWLSRRLLRRGALAPVFNRWIGALATLTVIVLFALVAEPNAPILRAAIAGALASLAVLSGRPLSLVNWLAFSAVGILACNPLELFRPGFQLSFVQVLALLTVVPRVYRRVVLWRPTAPRASDDERAREASGVWQIAGRYAWRAAVGLLVTSAVMWAIALPLVLLQFRYLAPWGVLGSFLLTLPVAFITVLSFIAMLMHAVPYLGSGLSAVLWWSTAALLRLVGLFAYLPAAVVEVQPPPVGLVAATYAALLALVVRQATGATAESAPGQAGVRKAGRNIRNSGGAWGRRLAHWGWLRGHAGWTAASALAALWGVWALLPRGSANEYRIHILSVGNGSAALVAAPDGHSALIDAGTDRNADAGETVAGAARALGIRQLEDVYVSHTNFDHYSGVPELLGRMPTKRLLLNPYSEAGTEDNPALRHFLELLRALRPATAAIRAGDRGAVGNMPIEVLWPPAELDTQTWPVNDRSLVLRLHAGGRTVLICGDIERAALRGLLEAERQGRVRLASDVLVAPHHGSVIRGDTAAFLRAVDPEVVVVSAADARPKFAALVRDTLGSERRVVVTGAVGAVTVRITRAGAIVVETPYGRAGGSGQ